MNDRKRDWLCQNRQENLNDQIETEVDLNSHTEAPTDLRTLQDHLHHLHVFGRLLRLVANVRCKQRLSDCRDLGKHQLFYNPMYMYLPFLFSF